MSEHNGSKYTPVPGKIPGTVVNMSGIELVLAPLNLDGVQGFMILQPQLVDAKTAEESFKIIANMLLLSFGRNYPDMTQEHVLALLDTANSQTAMLALADLSGIKLGKPGEPMPAPR